MVKFLRWTLHSLATHCLNPQVSALFKASSVLLLMFPVWSAFIYMLTRGSTVKMLLKKSTLSPCTSLLWFAKVWERTERRSRSKGSVMHSSKNSSVSSFSSSIRSSQALKKTGNVRFMWVLPWRTLASLQSLLLELSSPLTQGGVARRGGPSLPWVCNLLPWHSVLRPLRASVCSSSATLFKRSSLDSFPIQYSLLYSWALMYIWTNIFFQVIVISRLRFKYLTSILLLTWQGQFCSF